MVKRLVHDHLFLVQKSESATPVDRIAVEDMLDEDTVIMGGNPTPDITIEEMKLLATQAKTEKELADAYAKTSNKAWWVEDDIYDYEEGTPEYIEAYRITDEWFAVAEIIRNKIFEILKSEGVKVPKRGQIEVLKPFMARNGYRDGRGWWVRNND